MSKALAYGADWFEKHRLVHFTASPAAVTSILRLGFLLIPNRRQLISALLPAIDFSAREPQEFGMVSFTEMDSPTLGGSDHGPFGISVSWDWAIRHGAQRVLYLGDSGPVFEAFSTLFQRAHAAIWNSHINPGNQMKVENKVLSAAFRRDPWHAVWHSLLSLYEFMEPEPHSSEFEWRIVTDDPLYRNTRAPESNDDPAKTELIAEAIFAAETWKAGCIAVAPEDVDSIICPQASEPELREGLPDDFRNVRILGYPDIQVA